MIIYCQYRRDGNDEIIQVLTSGLPGDSLAPSFSMMGRLEPPKRRRPSRGSWFPCVMFRGSSSLLETAGWPRASFTVALPVTMATQKQRYTDLSKGQDERRSWLGYRGRAYSMSRRILIRDEKPLPFLPTTRLSFVLAMG